MAEHPELMKFLNEMPVTIPNEENPKITIESLETYYDSLVTLLDEYIKNRDKNELSNEVGKLPTTNVSMESDNSYQSLMTKVNNTHISYNDLGEGSTPVIFLHGFPFDKSMWKGQIDHLKTSYRVIACDIRGFGQSIDEETPLSIDLFGEDLLSFMNILKIEKAIVCGLSMGGFIALNAVDKFPERFEALILCDTQCIADTTEVKENRKRTIEKINLDGTAEFNEKFLKSVFHPDSLTSRIEVVENLRNIVFANSKRIINAGLTALAERSETCSTLSAIHIPTLIICGREDKVTPLEQSEFMHKHIEGSILITIDNAGHVSNLENRRV